MIYESLENALFEKDEKFKKTRLTNSDHNIEKYNLYGFTCGVQVLFFLFINKFYCIKYLIVVLFDFSLWLL